MRARWDFNFECTGIRFESTHNYGARITKEMAEEFGVVGEVFTALISIEPDATSYNPSVEQTGKLKITLPGNNEATKDLAFWLARRVVEQVTFSQGDMKINYGLTLGEHLPETPEEVEQIGDRPFFGEANLIQVPAAPEFDGSNLRQVSSNPLILHYNAAKNATNPVDIFLGMFKIMEDLYGPTSKKVRIADSLKTSDELRQIAQKYLYTTKGGVRRQLTNDDFLALIDKLVKVRHECAHLRTSKNFGITHGNPRVSTEVEPLISALRRLTFQAVQMRLQR